MDSIERRLLRSELIEEIDWPSSPRLVELVDEALTQSAITATTDLPNYERLEYLGDTLLKYAVPV